MEGRTSISYCRSLFVRTPQIKTSYKKILIIRISCSLVNVIGNSSETSDTNRTKFSTTYSFGLIYSSHLFDSQNISAPDLTGLKKSIEIG